MKNTIITLASVAVLNVMAHAQTFTTFDFSNGTTPINSGGSVIGYSFLNIFGDGSDAILDVTFDSANSSNFYQNGVTDAIFPINFGSGNVVLNNFSSQDVSTSAPADSSLGIFLRPDLDGNGFTSGLVIARFDFFLHDSLNNAINGRIRSSVFDVDGDTQSGNGFIHSEQIVALGSDLIQVSDPNFLTVTGNTINAPDLASSPPNINPATDSRGTVQWYNSLQDGRWSVEHNFNSTSDVDPSRGAIMDIAIVVPEPSSTALLGLGTLGLLIRRRR